LSKLKDHGEKLMKKLNESELEVASISSEIEELDVTSDKRELGRYLFTSIASILFYFKTL
jgi:hypothetical protein